MRNRTATKQNRSGLLYAWYGDDFTGSTDVLEGLGLSGVPAVLFTRVPSKRDLAAFPGCRAIGIAGESRSRTPVWMSRNLPPIFAAMRRLGAPVNQYKVCSTFDSSPRIGSIGRAMELGMRAFGAPWVPVVVGAPHLGRSVAFANLFAAAQGEMHRIDRHPTMCRHPVTPMLEPDLRLHLGQQTHIRIGDVDLRSFQRGASGKHLERELAAGAEAIVFDGIDEAMLVNTARLLWHEASLRQVFAVGSSGLTYGLLGLWRGMPHTLGLPEQPSAWNAPNQVDCLLVLSGSCSPVTARQIWRARQQGFVTIRLTAAGRWEAATRKTLAALGTGKSVVLYTALGRETRDRRTSAFGRPLGALLRRLVLASGVRRILIAGGDTATHAVKRLGLTGLTFVAPLSPGAPLCRGHAAGSPLDGLELVLKGGQIGPDEFFAQVRDGRA